MRTPTVLHGLAGLVLSSTLVATSGCAWLLKSTAQAVADEHPGSAPPAARSSEGSGQDPPREGGTGATYQYGPTLDWRADYYGMPYSITRSLVESANPTSPLCVAVPLGLSEVLAVPNGAPSQPMLELGPVHFGLAGNVVPLGTVLTTNRMVAAERAFSSGARLADQGPECSHRLFFYMQIVGDSNGSVRVLR